MKEVIHINQAHLNYVSSLLKWRILDVENLRKENIYVPQKDNFYRIIRDLEKKKILEGFREPFSKKKYVYLSPFGERQFALRENPTSISEGTILHDLRVTEIARSFLDYGWIAEAELEHEVHDKRNFRTSYKIIPDALFHGVNKGKGYKMALELELSQKNNQRILEKGKQYAASSYFNYVLYLFVRKELMKKYVGMFKETLSVEDMKRFMFFTVPTFLEEENDLKSANGIYQGKEVKLRELFERS